MGLSNGSHTTPELIRNMKEEIQSNKDMQNKAIIFWLASTAVIAALTAGIGTIWSVAAGVTATAGTLTTSAVVWAMVVAGIKSAIMFLALRLSLQTVANVSPEMGKLLGYAFDLMDAGFFYTVQGICWFIDQGGKLLGGDFKDGTTISKLGPLIFGSHTIISDREGTIPRLMASSWMDRNYGEEQDWRQYYFEDYEIAMMDGRQYDWSSYGQDLFGGGLTDP